MFDPLLNILYATNPPVASLLDDNWISRSVADLPVMVGGQIESSLIERKDENGFVWLFPERYLERAEEIIRSFTPFTCSSARNDAIAWRIGWSISSRRE